MSQPGVWVLWIGPGHRINTCVEVPANWLTLYRQRVVGEWRGRVLGVYRMKHSTTPTTAKD